MFSEEGVQTCSRLLSSAWLQVQAVEEGRKEEPTSSAPRSQYALLSQPSSGCYHPLLVSEQIGWGRGVGLHGLVMAQTRVQSPGSLQTGKGGGRKERLGVVEY